MAGAKIGKLSHAPWSQLSTKPYVTSLNKITDVTDMNLRVIQRFLAHTITQRDENNERPNLQDMWYLEQFNDNMMINIPYCLAWYLVKKAEGRRENSPICGGHYITCFAQYFGINYARLTLVRDPRFTVGEAMYFSVKAVRKVGNTFEPWPVAESESPPHQGQRMDDGPSHMEEDGGEEDQEHEQADPSLASIMQGIQGIQVSTNRIEGSFNEFRNEFHDYRHGMDYRVGNLEYRTDWTMGNLSWIAEQQGYNITRPEPLHQWGTPEASQYPPPVYDHSTAVQEAQRLHQEEYDRNIQQEWRDREASSAAWNMWPSEEEIRRRQEEQYRHSGFWPFGSDD